KTTPNWPLIGGLAGAGVFVVVVIIIVIISVCRKRRESRESEKQQFDLAAKEEGFEIGF
ncbi:hypothetical protein OS493_040340, partial [Desmophyllum pertusum]